MCGRCVYCPAQAHCSSLHVCSIAHLQVRGFKATEYSSATLHIQHFTTCLELPPGLAPSYHILGECDKFWVSVTRGGWLQARGQQCPQHTPKPGVNCIPTPTRLQAMVAATLTYSC